MLDQCDISLHWKLNAFNQSNGPVQIPITAKKKQRNDILMRKNFAPQQTLIKLLVATADIPSWQ